jgi:hypothetical protein
MDAKRHLMRLAAGILIILANAVSGFAQVAPPRPPKSTSCLPYEVLQRTYDGDYDGALALSEECAESHMRLVDPAGLVLDPAIPSSFQSAYSAGWAYAFLCATAQLQALTGNTRAAETTLARAEQFLNTWPGFHNFLVATDLEILSATRGFIEERAGRITASTLAYQSAGEVGASRLAVIALSQGDDAQAAVLAIKARTGVEARRLSIGVIATALPTALAVQGSLAELRGDPYEAFYRYYASEQEMRRMLEPYPTSAALPEGSGPTRPRPPGMSNASSRDYQPMLLAERPRVIKALAMGPTTVPATAKPLPIVAKAQQAFNDWLKVERSRATPGLAFRRQYPRFFAGFTREDRDLIRRRKMTRPSDFDVNAVLTLPESIEVTGLLDRDTLALDLYKLTAGLLSVAARASVSPADLLSPAEPRGLSPERRMVVNELRTALTQLQTLHARLQSSRLTTNSGAVLTAFDEIKLKSWTADASTAHMMDLTPELAESVSAIATKARDHITAAQRFLPPQ